MPYFLKLKTETATYKIGPYQINGLNMTEVDKATYETLSSLPDFEAITEESMVAAKPIVDKAPKGGTLEVKDLPDGGAKPTKGRGKKGE